MTKTPPKRRKSLPIFAKCLIILFGTCGILAATLTVLSDRTSNHVAKTAVETLGSSITNISASQIAGPVRFRDAEALEARFQALISGTQMADGVVVVGADGQVLLRLPEDLSAEMGAALTGYAEQIVALGTASSSQNGLLIAEPIMFGKDNAVIGAVAIKWNPTFLENSVRQERLVALGAGLAVTVVLSLLAMFAVRQTLSLPLTRMNERTNALANEDYTSDIPYTSRGDEIGQSAISLKTLRDKLAKAEDAKRGAFFKSAGFQSSSAAMILCDSDLCISHVNRSFLDLAERQIDAFTGHIPDFDPHALIGVSADVFHTRTNTSREMLENAPYPIETDIRMGQLLLGLVINKIVDSSDATAGYVLEWSEVTERRKRTAILQSLEEAQLRADFGADGRLTSVNSLMAQRLELADGQFPNTTMREFVAHDSDADFNKVLRSGKAVFGKFKTEYAGQCLSLDGSISPTRDRSGRVLGFVLLGNDITESEKQLKDATEENERLSAAQAAVVSALQSALTSLSQGDLQIRIDEAFSGEYEVLRVNFNTAVSELDDAIGLILNSADSILNESSNVSSAADDLSRRTEQQAATLEEPAAAISELTASVASAASGAKQANDVVTDARDNAAASGEVVQQAVDAMGEISNSSDQISRIIGVIDEIAFQTNLLALNAGVEAARAGDAGRGFAVVASEVRALAQRSSEAAREITDLISTSGEHVKKGVSLVDKAGHALTEIGHSVGGIADQGSGIAASAREQSTGLEEINAAMNQLDQVTQKNVAMFEETTAASKTMTAEANALVGITRKFATSSKSDIQPMQLETVSSRSDTPAGARGPGVKPSANAGATARTCADGVARPNSAPMPDVSGNLALATEDIADDNWEEF